MEQGSAQLQAFLIHGCSSLGISLRQDQLRQFGIYHRELITWNQKINLTTVTEFKAVAVKHFIDSLACCKVLEQPASQATILDVGSGPGFPGLPLKILYPALRVSLLEPNQKKTAFLRHIIGSLDLQHVRVFPHTLEEFSRQSDHHREFEYAMTRAVNIRPLARYVVPLLTRQGKLVLCRSTSIACDPEWNEMALVKEIPYELPYKAGRRVLTILGPVPRGTSG